MASDRIGGDRVFASIVKALDKNAVQGSAWIWRRGHLRLVGIDLPEAKRLKVLEDENTRLKRLLADAMLDNAALMDLLGIKW